MSTIQIAPDLDAHIEGIAFPNANTGSVDTQQFGVIYTDSKSFLFRSIFRFDMSAIPAGATINSAKLVRTISGVFDGGFGATIKRCTRPSTVTEDGVTWNKYDGSNAWTSGGGDMDDTTPTPVTFTEASATGTKEVTGMKGFVTDAIANRSDKVCFIMYLTDEDPGASDQVFWRTKEYATEADRPYLEVDYTPAAGVPRRRAPTQVF